MLHISPYLFICLVFFLSNFVCIQVYCYILIYILLVLINLSPCPNYLWLTRIHPNLLHSYSPGPWPICSISLMYLLYSNFLLFSYWPRPFLFFLFPFSLWSAMLFQFYFILLFTLVFFTFILVPPHSQAISFGTP
jgi:hypothetical protein